MSDRYEQVGVAMTCRSFDEYVRMFALEEGTLDAMAPVLDVAGGASSFTASLRAMGIPGVAVDPLYSMTPVEIVRFGEQEIETATAKLAQLAHRYDWSYYGDLEQHRVNRVRSLAQFADHYRLDEARDLYRLGALPELPFAKDTFGLVVCSHFLFLYADQFDEAFHHAAVRELLRVCRPGGEVRIYPLVSLSYEAFPGMADLLQELEAEGVHCHRTASRLPFLPGSTELLVLQK